MFRPKVFMVVQQGMFSIASMAELQGGQERCHSVMAVSFREELDLEES